VVAAVGGRNTGEVLLLENHTTDWDKPDFRRRVIDKRHGAIQVPVGDLNGDGWPDIVALIGQEHQTVVAYLNQKDGTFRQEEIWRGPHPAFGCSGIQLVDLDGDGDLDVLLSNGDVRYTNQVLRPYHGVHWLENRGTFPFKEREVGRLSGAHRAIAA